MQASDRRRQDKDSAVHGSQKGVEQVVEEHIQPILDDLRAVAKEDFRKASKADRRRKILKMIAENLRKLATLNLTLSEFLKEKPFPAQPYCRPQAKEFFMAVKLGETMKVRKLLIGCKYLVYEFDQTRMTALHWAARRGRLEIGEALIKHGADVNKKDDLERAPLYYAVEANDFAFVKMLLLKGANVWGLADIKNWTPQQKRETEILIMLTEDIKKAIIGLAFSKLSRQIKQDLVQRMVARGLENAQNQLQGTILPQKSA